jgi:hypothetical protein
MKTLTLITFLAVVPGFLLADSGAIQASLNSTWQAGPLGAPRGKVVLNLPVTRQKLNLTYIFQGAAPSTTYAAGFDIICVFGSSCPAVATAGTPGAPFGTPQNPLSNNYNGVDLRIYPLGTVTTDVDGDASVHFNLGNLPPGSYKITFWVSLFSDALNPVAATSSYMIGPYVNVDVTQ